MNIERLTDSELADMAENIATLLGGTELSAIDAGVRTDLLTAIGTLPATLASQTADVIVQDTQKQASVSAKNLTHDQLLIIVRQVRDNLRAGRAPEQQYDLCGFDYPLSPRSAYIASDPSDLAAYGFSNGVNKLAFKGNNKSGLVVYEIWKREGDEGAWGHHAITRKQVYTDPGNTPGQYYEYRVRAIASQSISNFSNSAVVYGML